MCMQPSSYSFDMALNCLIYCFPFCLEVLFKKNPWGFLAWRLAFDVSLWWKSPVLHWGFSSNSGPSKVWTCCRPWLLVSGAVIVWEFLWIASRYFKTLFFQVSMDIYIFFESTYSYYAMSTSNRLIATGISLITFKCSTWLRTQHASPAV